MTWEVGQEVFVEGKPRVITKVGRKWGYLNGPWNTRFALETGTIDSEYGATTKVWREKNEYLETVLADKLFAHLRRSLNWRRPAKLGSKELLDVLTMLGIDPPEGA